MIRVVVAEDHPTVRLGVILTLEKAGGVSVVGQAATPDELYAVLNAVPCDVLLTDLSMPDGELPDGLHMLERIARLFPTLPVVVLTMAAHPDTLRAIHGLGCLGICDKASPFAETVIAVHRAMDGEGYLCGAATAALAHPLAGTLSPKEVEVVRLLAQGLAIDEIAARLNRSRKTISRQKCDAMLAIGADSDEALVAYARVHGLG